MGEERERDGEERGRRKEESKPIVSPILCIIVEATRRCSWAGSAFMISIAWQSQGRRRRGGEKDMNEVDSGVRDENET